MVQRKRRERTSRKLCPVLAPLEGRTLLSAGMPKHGHVPGASAEVRNAHHHGHAQSRMEGPSITSINRVSFDGFQFTNFDGPSPGNTAGTGTNMNGISNSGSSVGFTIDNNGNFLNFVTNPLKSRSARLVNLNGSTTAMAFAVNSAGTVVGTDGNGNAFFLHHGTLKTFLPEGGTSAVALGINDHGTVVGQFTNATATPGFIRLNGNKFVTVNAPSGPNVVNVQGINNKGLLVGFYVGTDSQDHGFVASERDVQNGTLTGNAVADPIIPNVPGEPRRHLRVLADPRDQRSRYRRRILRRLHHQPARLSLQHQDRPLHVPG